MPSQRCLLLEVCLLAIPLAAQSPAPTPPPPAFEVGVNWVNDILLSGQNGASLEGTYFFKGSVPKWGGRDSLGITAEFAGSGNTSARLYTYMAGLRWGTEWRHFYAYGGLEMGGARVDTRGLSNAGATASLIRNSFTSSFSAGIELLMGQHYAIKLESESPGVMAPFPSTGHGMEEGDIRSSAGIVYRFSRRQP